MNFEQFNQINSIVCVSDYETGVVMYLNRHAKEHFGLTAVPPRQKLSELLSKDEITRRTYIDIPLDPGEIFTKFVPTLCDLPWPAILESVRLTHDGRSIRVDSVRQIVADDKNSDSLYTMLFESAYLHLESTYHGTDFPENNVRECLSVTLMLYEADRAYVLELDEELEACQYLYTKTRDGVVSAEDEAVGTMLFSNLFTDIIIKNEPFLFTTEDLRDTHPAEYDWLKKHNIFNAMGVPFKTRTQMVAFYCVNNVRRFWQKTSFLSLSTKALFNEIRAIDMFRLSKSAKHKTQELSDEDVLIRLFGGFEIITNSGTLDFADFSSVQCSRFLLYLLKNRNRTIPIREIADILWPDQLIDNPYNMVKGVAFRVRKILDSICTDKLVIARSGTYAINDQLTIIVDVDSFDLICSRIHSQKLSSYEKQYLYKKAINLYKGDMLPNYESEIWLLGWISYYQIKYLEILKEYLALLREMEEYGKIFEVVSNVLSVGYADGEIHEVLIDALLRQNKLEMAKSYYMRVEKFLTPDQRKSFVNSWKDYKK